MRFPFYRWRDCELKVQYIWTMPSAKWSGKSNLSTSLVNKYCRKCLLMVFDSTASLCDALASGTANGSLDTLAADPARQPLEITTLSFIYSRTNVLGMEPTRQFVYSFSWIWNLAWHFFIDVLIIWTMSTRCTQKVGGIVGRIWYFLNSRYE